MMMIIVTMVVAWNSDEIVMIDNDNDDDNGNNDNDNDNADDGIVR